MTPSTPLIGHILQREQFQQDLDSGNVSHAYLLSGPRHLGKMTIARWFARQLLTVDSSSDEKKKVESQINHLVHPDLLVLDQLWIEDVCDDWDQIAKTSNVSQVHRSKKPPAKTDVISIDDIRALQDRLVETCTGRFRCCIIRSVERMQDEAANAFLKILEEPPAGLVFLLTTQSESSLLPTIISRARLLRFRRLSQKELLPTLEGVSEDDVQFILHLAAGAPGIVRALRDDPDALRIHRQVHATTQSFWNTRSLRERLQILSPLKVRGEEANRFLFHLGLTLREQSPKHLEKDVAALQNLAEGLKTNAHRQLLAQRFALSVESK